MVGEPNEWAYRGDASGYIEHNSRTQKFFWLPGGYVKRGRADVCRHRRVQPRIPMNSFTITKLLGCDDGPRGQSTVVSSRPSETSDLQNTSGCLCLSKPSFERLLQPSTKGGSWPVLGGCAPRNCGRLRPTRCRRSIGVRANPREHLSRCAEGQGL